MNQAALLKNTWSPLLKLKCFRACPHPRVRREGASVSMMSNADEKKD